MSCMRIGAVAAIALAVQAPALASSDAEASRAGASATGLPLVAAREVRLTYNGFFFGLRVMKANVTAAMGAAGYEASSEFRTAGLAGFFKDARIQAVAKGALDAGRVAPASYAHQNLASKKKRKIEIDFTGAEVEARVDPPFGSLGEPPATPAQRREALDPIGVFLQIAIAPAAEPCKRTLPVFDGKRRYNLRFEPAGRERLELRGFQGDSAKCHIYYEPVAGFDADELEAPEVYERPITMWLADVGGGFLAPVRIKTEVKGMGVTVEAKAVERGPGLGGPAPE